MKRIGLIFLVVVLCLPFIACHKSSERSAAKADEQQAASDNSSAPEITIGCCVMDMANEIFVQYVEGYKAFCEATGNKVKLIVVDGSSQPERQVEALENFISVGVDAIMLNAVDLSAVEDVVHRAMDSGIKVGIYPSMDGVTMNFVFDEYQWGFSLGVAAGNWINDELAGKAVVACFNQAELETALGRYYGYVDGVLSVCKKENITFLEPISTVEPVSAMEGMENILQAHPDVKVVLCSADAAAVGAYQAIVGAGIDTSKMFLGGCDGISEALGYIAKGSVFRATCANQYLVQDMGFALLQKLTKACLGMDYDGDYIAPTFLVDKTNVAEYMSREPEYTLDDDLAAVFR